METSEKMKLLRIALREAISQLALNTDMTYQQAYYQVMKQAKEKHGTKTN